MAAPEILQARAAASNLGERRRSGQCTPSWPAVELPLRADGGVVTSPAPAALPAPRSSPPRSGPGPTPRHRQPHAAAPPAPRRGTTRPPPTAPRTAPCPPRARCGTPPPPPSLPLHYPALARAAADPGQPYTVKQTRTAPRDRLSPPPPPPPPPRAPWRARAPLACSPLARASPRARPRAPAPAWRAAGHTRPPRARARLREAPPPRPTHPPGRRATRTPKPL